MSLLNGRVVILDTRVACTGYRGRRGDVVVSKADDFVGIVQSPSAAPAELDTTPFVPSDDNLTDLGQSNLRFRTLYIGTAIANPAGDIEVRFNQATARRLVVANANGGGTANVAVQGSLAVGEGNTNGPARVYNDSDTLQLVAAGSAGTPATRGLRVMQVNNAVNELRAYPSATGVPVFISSEGDDAAVPITISAKGNDVIKLLDQVDIGGSGTATIAFFGGTRRPQQANIANPAGGGTVDAEARAAIISILSILRASSGFGLTLG